MEKEDTILKALKTAGKPMKMGELAESTGIEKKEIDKILKNLMKEGKIHSPIRCYYDIKNQT